MTFSFDEFLRRRDRDRRLARLTHDIPLPIAQGLEFGPSDNPVALPDSFAVAYVEHPEAEMVSDAVNIQHRWSGTGSLSAIVGEAAPFDFAIASQVAQYVPNLLDWWRGIFDVLKVGGVMNMSLPDRRFMFDIRRKESTLGELIEAHHMQLERPSYRQIFDHTFGAAAIDASRIWAEDVDIAAVPRFSGEHALALAYEQKRREKGFMRPATVGCSRR